MALKPGELREGERPEQAMYGPFSGVQSEVPSHLIEMLNGFQNVTNVMFRKAMATVRPGYTPLKAFPAPVNESINGIADFFDSTGNRHQVAITPTRLLEWHPLTPAWVVVAGALTGPASALFKTAVVGQKLCFCQGIDKVQLWNGITPGFADASVNAVPAKYLAEIANHLVVGNTIEAGNAAPQRVRWTGAGDATDWISFNAGQVDLFNDFGPITGIIKLYQTGFIFQYRGICFANPTGLGVRPFDFPSFGARARGNVMPYSLDVFNETLAFYGGEDNIYMFTGTACEPVGDAPMQGSRIRVGARTKIFADIRAVDLNTVWGVVTTEINGRDFNAYWLIIPGVSVWVLNIDEMNWTRFTYGTGTSKVVTARPFSNAGPIRIIDLVGSIADQNWTPATLVNANVLDSFLLGFSDGVPGIVDFSSFSEQNANLLSGSLILGDRRHEKTIYGLRFILQDLGPISFSVTLINEKGDSKTTTISVGTGTGNMITAIANFKITGMYLTWSVNIPAGQPWSCSEVSPLYEIANEYKTNTF